MKILLVAAVFALLGAVVALWLDARRRRPRPILRTTGSDRRVVAIQGVREDLVRQEEGTWLGFKWTASRRKPDAR